MDGAVAGCYKTDDNKYIEYEQVSEAINKLAGKNIFSSIITAIDEWGLNASEAQSLFEFGIVPPSHNPPDCGCEVSETTMKYDGHVVYQDENGYYYESYGQVDDGNGGKKDNVGNCEKIYLTEGQEPTTENTGSIKKVGSECKKYWKAAVKYMRKDNDYDYDTYTPYIEKVEDHWYRDVYFVANKDEELVDYDYDYEAIMKERWTLYETYGTDSDRMGEYKLYALKEDGNYATSESEIFYQDENKKNTTGSVYTEENGYILYSGTYDDAKKLTISVAKKPVTIKIGDNYKDLNWNEVSSNKYSAYSTEVNTSSDYQQLYHAGEEEYDKEDDGTIKKAMEHIYAKVDVGNITQTGEGQRGVTNSKIKKMFLQNRYFVYNGDKLRAEAITAMRNDEKNGFDYGPLVKSDGTPYTLEELEEKKITLNKDGDVVSENSTEEKTTFTAKDLSGNVSINQESLDAFTMLENTHTLDADYIYRDFKELIVELGYFEKDELTDETPRVMEFPVPEIGSGGFPNRTIDKIETENGTMIHSKDDIGANDKNTLLELISQMENEIPDNIANQQAQQVQSVSRITSNKGLLSQGSNINLTEIGAIDSGGESKSVSQVSIDEFLETTREMCEYINEEGYDYCVLVTDAGNGEQYCHHAPVHNNGCVLPKTFADSQESVSKHNFCCATLVSWALQNVGVMPDSAHLDGAKVLAEWITNNLDPQKIEKGQPLKPGDILCYNQHIDLVGEEKDGGGFVKYNGGHYAAIGAQEFTEHSCIEEMSDWPGSANYALRLNWGNSSGKEGSYEGYKGNEAVVSPVTGILLEYGTYEDDDKDNIVNDPERVNVDLKYGNLVTKGVEKEEGTQGGNLPDPNTTPQEIQADKVGYAKILVLNSAYYKALESQTDNRWKKAGISLVNITEQQKEDKKTIKSYYSDYNGSDLILSEKEQLNDDNLDGNDSDAWPEIDKLVYGYKEFAETYEYAGIGGYVVYIDGFVCEEPDEEFTEEDLKEKVPYQDNETARNEAKISLDRYKEITEDIVSSDNDEDKEKILETYYKSPEEYKMASEKATKKLNAELAVKNDAASSIYIPNVKIDDETKDAIFIKEGTILGRTMTDRELIMEIREQDEEKLKEYRPSYFDKSQLPEPTGKDDEEPKEKVMGNYIRVIMRDLVDTPIENVEDYMKLDDGGSKKGVYADLEAIDENSTDQEKVRAIMSYLVEQGFTPEGAAGIVGNLIQESGLDPTAQNSSGYRGLAQWSKSWFPDIDGWMSTQGYNSDSFAGQVRAIYEADNRGQMTEDKWSELKGLTKIDQAAELFMVYYEGCVGGSDPTTYYLPGKNYQETKNRKQFAQNAYDIYMGDDSIGIKDNAQD